MSLHPNIPNASIASPKGVAQAIQDLRRDVSQLKAPNLAGAVTYLYRNATLSVPAHGAGGASDLIQYDSYMSGMGSGQSVSNHGFVAVSTGVHLVFTQLRYSPAPSNAYSAQFIQLNGNYWGPWGEAAISANGGTAFTALPLVPGDLVQASVFSTSTTAWGYLGGNDSTFMIVVKVG